MDEYLESYFEKEGYVTSYRDVDEIKKLVSLLVRRFDSFYILDIGCAKGYFVKYFNLEKSVVSAFGMDISKWAIENYEENVRNNLILADIQDRKTFKWFPYEFILCLETLEHLPKPIDAMKNMSYLLNKKGTVVLSVISDTNKLAERDSTNLFIKNEEWWIEFFKENSFIIDWSNTMWLREQLKNWIYYGSRDWIYFVLKRSDFNE